MAESALNKRLKTALAPFDPVRVENPACPGTPDINLSIGWIESKWIERWPRSGIVQCKHYTPEQKVWAIKRITAGGRCWLMLQVEADYLLFRGDIAAKYFGRSDELTLRDNAIAVWEKKLNDEGLRGALLSWK